MSTVKICDRCGRSGANRGWVEARVTGAEWGGVFDFCERCAAEFGRWVKEVTPT